MDDETKRIKAFIEALRQKTERLGQELDTTRKLAQRSDERRIDKLLRRRKKSRQDDNPQGHARTD